MQNKYIYIVKTVDLTRKTEESLQKEFEITQVRYPDTWKGRPIEDYIGFLKSWKWDKFEIHDENNAYCTTYEEALNRVKYNACGMDDGTYNYVVIAQVLCDYGYAETDIEDLQVFKFNCKEDFLTNR
jgi:hypothetical protein